MTPADLIAASLLPTPLPLFRKYKGHRPEAKLLPNAKVDFQAQLYDSCSTAAEVARGTITGRRMNTNGWAFWQYVDGDGRKQTLDEARQKLLAMKGKALE